MVSNVGSYRGANACACHALRPVGSACDVQCDLSCDLWNVMKLTAALLCRWETEREVGGRCVHQHPSKWFLRVTSHVNCQMLWSWLPLCCTDEKPSEKLVGDVLVNIHLIMYELSVRPPDEAAQELVRYAPNHMKPHLLTVREENSCQVHT